MTRTRTGRSRPRRRRGRRTRRRIAGREPVHQAFAPTDIRSRPKKVHPAAEDSGGVQSDPGVTWRAREYASDVDYFGSSTVSITWITPFDAPTSAWVTVALSTITLPSTTLIATDWPLTVFAPSSLTTSAAITLPGTTW